MPCTHFSPKMMTNILCMYIYTHMCALVICLEMTLQASGNMEKVNARLLTLVKWGGLG